jgi:D-alanyl-D-alanine carboxypeptidase
MAFETRRLFLLNLLLGLGLLLAACGREQRSLYNELHGDEDGLVATDVETKGVDNDTHPVMPDELSQEEAKHIQTYLRGQNAQVSFLVVNASSKGIVKSFQARKVKSLASVTKLATAIATLDNDSDRDMGEVSSMLKSSNNSLASKYVRRAARAISGVIVPGKPFTAAHSCPGSTAVEAPAAQAVFTWLKQKHADADWAGADLRDGSGCNHDNRFSALQVVELIEFADSHGRAWNGKTFADLLSINGVEGTWAARNRDSRGMIFAKTGTLSNASNLAGFIILQRGGRIYKYYFAVMIEKTSRDTTARSRALIESLVRVWIKSLTQNEVLLNGNL